MLSVTEFLEAPSREAAVQSCTGEVGVVAKPIILSLSMLGPEQGEFEGGNLSYIARHFSK